MAYHSYLLRVIHRIQFLHDRLSCSWQASLCWWFDAEWGGITVGSEAFLESSSLFTSNYSFPFAVPPAGSAATGPARKPSTNRTGSVAENRPADPTPTVYIVDHDPQALESLIPLVRNIGLKVEAYPSAEAFLDGFREDSHSSQCIVAALRLPGLSGLGLLRTLKSQQVRVPVIMISACGDIQMVVEAMRTGAINFLEKPIDGAALAAGIREAIDCDIRRQRDEGHKSALLKRVNILSSRQREVFDRLVAGDRTKQIANLLGIGEKTVAKHRASVLDKMQVDSVVDLVRVFAETQATIQI